MYWRNGRHLPHNKIASLVWDIFTDAAQFFYTFPTEEECNMDPQMGISTSNLAVRHSLLSANLHVPSLDTPGRWLTSTPINNRGRVGLGATREDI